MTGSFQGGTTYPVTPAGLCGIPSTATAYSMNVTVLPHNGYLGYLTVWPAGEALPTSSAMNSPDGRNKADAVIVPAGASNAVNFYASDTTDVLVDVNGYFSTPGAQTLQFYPLTQCRAVDTRLGSPLTAGQETDFHLAGTCGLPSTAVAYSLNLTVVPTTGPLNYLTVWPQGQTMPLVSTLNNPTGTLVANAAIVAAGSNGTTAFYPASNSTNLVIDVNGYFAPAGTGGLSLYPVAPCRVLDTRLSGGAFQNKKIVNVVGSACLTPNTAQAFVLNATVLPVNGQPLSYLTLWPDPQTQPAVSTLNATDGSTMSNMSIVGNGNGSIDAWAQGNPTQLLLDISSYFAP